MELVVKRYYFRKSADFIQSSAGGNHVNAKGCDGTQTVGSGWSGIRSGAHGAVVGDIQLTERMFHLVLDNVKICPENSCNRDIRMMRTNELLFKISDAEIISLVEEGYNEYDADGNLKHTYPDEEVEKAKYDEVAQVLLEGTIYELTLQSGVYTFIIDGTNDRTYALKVTGSGDTQEWNRFLEV